MDVDFKALGITHIPSPICGLHENFAPAFYAKVLRESTRTKKLTPLFEKHIGNACIQKIPREPIHTMQLSYMMYYSRVERYINALDHMFTPRQYILITLCQQESLTHMSFELIATIHDYNVFEVTTNASHMRTFLDVYGYRSVLFDIN